MLILIIIDAEKAARGEAQILGENLIKLGW